MVKYGHQTKALDETISNILFIWRKADKNTVFAKKLIFRISALVVYLNSLKCSIPICNNSIKHYIVELLGTISTKLNPKKNTSINLDLN